MKKVTLFLLFLSPFLSLNAQYKQRFQAMKLAVCFKPHTYVETGYFFGMESGLGSEGAAYVFGPAASLEFPLRENTELNTADIVGIKTGFEFHTWLPFGTRMNMGYYTNGKQYSWQLAPELGFTFDGIINVFIGQNFPLTNKDFVDNKGTHITVMLNMPVYFKNFYDDKPPEGNFIWNND